MNKIDWQKIGKEVTKFCVSHKKELRTGASIGGYLAAIIFTADATKKTEKAIKRREDELDANLSKKEKFKVSWKYWIKPFMSGGVAIGLQLWDYSDTKKEIVALNALVELGSNYISECKKEAIELIGEDKVREIENEVHKKNIEERLPSVIDRRGDQLYYEPFTGSLFWTNEAKIKNAESLSKDELYDGGCVSLNKWLEWVDDSHVDCECGNILGWKGGGSYGTTKCIQVADCFDAINVPNPFTGERMSAIVITFLDEPSLDYSC